VEKRKSDIILGSGHYCCGWLLLFLRVLTTKDNGICDNGQWVEYENPLSAKLTESCGTNANCSKSSGIITNFDSDEWSLTRIDTSNKFGWLDAGLSGEDAKFIWASGG